MTVEIHIGSMLFGVLIGYLLIGSIFLKLYFDGRYDEGFSKGWGYGYSHTKQESEEEDGQ